MRSVFVIAADVSKVRAARGLKQLQQFIAMNQHFSLSCYAARVEFFLTNV